MVKESMKPIVINVYILLMFMAYVMRRAGTFSLEEKTKMVEFLGYVAQNHDKENYHDERFKPLLNIVVPRLNSGSHTGWTENERV